MQIDEAKAKEIKRLPSAGNVQSLPRKWALIPLAVALPLLLLPSTHPLVWNIPSGQFGRQMSWLCFLRDLAHSQPNGAGDVL